MLPGRDGLEFCRRVSVADGLAIILLTARGHATDIVVGLACGADDCVVIRSRSRRWAGVGNGHLVLVAASPYYGSLPDDGRLWYRMAIVIGAGVLLSVLAGVLVAFSMRRPLRRIATAAQKFGEG